MITLLDVQRLPPSPARDALIKREREAFREDVRAKVRAQWEREATTAEVIEGTRLEADRILRTIRRDPRKVVHQRRVDLLAEVYPRDERRAA